MVGLAFIGWKNGLWKMTDLQLCVEREFGKSPLRLYQEMRSYSTFRTIAATMEISEDTLRKWRIAWGESLCSRTYSDDRVFDEFSFSVSPTDISAKDLGYVDTIHAVGCMAKEGLTNKEMAEMLDCSERTILRYKPREWKQRDYD